MPRNQAEPEDKSPLYELTQAAYIDDRYYEAGAQIRYDGVPGHHMDPMNDAAEAMKSKNPSKYIDPILAMTVVN
jgi:hypothetical protein